MYCVTYSKKNILSSENHFQTCGTGPEELKAWRAGRISRTVFIVWRLFRYRKLSKVNNKDNLFKEILYMSIRIFSPFWGILIKEGWKESGKGKKFGVKKGWDVGGSSLKNPVSYGPWIESL